jgi:DMSO reductase anchor subunit
VAVQELTRVEQAVQVAEVVAVQVQLLVLVAVMAVALDLVITAVTAVAIPAEVVADLAEQVPVLTVGLVVAVLLLYLMQVQRKLDQADRLVVIQVVVLHTGSILSQVLEHSHHNVVINNVSCKRLKNSIVATTLVKTSSVKCTILAVTGSRPLNSSPTKSLTRK